MTKKGSKLPISRFDDYVNTLTGLGDPLRDKSTFGVFSSNGRIDYQTLEDLYHENDMAARICDIIPEEVFRQGYEIKTGDDSEAYNDNLEYDISYDLGKNFKQAQADPNKASIESIIMSLDDFKVREKFIEAMIWSRVFGGAAIYVGLEDGRAQDAPLDEKRIQKVSFLTVLDSRDLFPFSWYTDPLSKDYGKPEIYRLNPVSGFVGNSKEIGRATEQDIYIHESRLLIFEGSRSTKRRRIRNGGWADSLLQKLDTVLRQFSVSWQATAYLMQDCSQAVFKMSGFNEALSANRPDYVTMRLANMDMNRSVARALVVDAESGEDFRRDSYSFNGVPQINELFMQRLSGAVGIPVSVLFGKAPAGMNATGESDIRLFYDKIASMQKYDIKPELERLIRFFMLSKEGPTKGKELDNWAVCFPEPWQMTETEKADINLKKANTVKSLQEAALLADGIKPKDQLTAATTENNPVLDVSNQPVAQDPKYKPKK